MRNIDFLSIIRKISNRPQLSLKQIFTPNVCTVERRGARAVCLVSNITRIVHSDLFFQHKIMYLYLICASIKQRPISCMLEQLMCAFASNIDARCTTLWNGQESFSYRLNQTGPPILVILKIEALLVYVCSFVGGKYENFRNDVLTCGENRIYRYKTRALCCLWMVLWQSQALHLLNESFRNFNFLWLNQTLSLSLSLC